MSTAKTKALLVPWILPSSSSTMKRRFWPIAVALAYITLIYFLGGMQWRHLMMASLVFLDSYNERSRQFLAYFLPFMLTGIAYDSMRYYYWQGIEGHIHVAEPYFLEKSFFGIREAGQVVTPNEYFQAHTWKVMDFFCGLAYLVFVLEYLSTAFLLFFFEKWRLLRAFGWCFFLVNVMGFATYYIYPAAPPWYVTQYGLGSAHMFIHATPSAATRFDLLFGTHFFDAMYGQSVDVYGAIPSLHVAYPLLVVWSAAVTRKFRSFAIAFYFLMCFSAVYLQHHYIIDVILGTLYAFLALMVVRYVQEGEALSAVPWRARVARLLWLPSH